MKDFILQPIIELKNPLKILFWSCRLFKGVLRLWKMSRKISVMEFLLAICNSSNYSLQPYLACFYHSGKFLRKSVEWSSFSQKQTLTQALCRIAALKRFLEKTQEGLRVHLKRTPPWMFCWKGDKVCRNFRSSYFFKTTMDGCFWKFK